MCKEKVIMDKDELERLLRDNMKLIYKIVNSFVDVNSSIYEDVLQEAIIGFIKAVRNFNPEKGVKLTTYIYSSVTFSIKSFFYKNNDVKYSVKAKDKVNKYKYMIENNYDSEFIRSKLSISYDEEIEIINMLSDRIRLNISDEESSSVEEVVGDNREYFYDNIDILIIEEDLKHILNNKQYQVFKMVMTNGYSRKEVAQILGVTEQRITAIVKEIRERCRDYFYEDRNKDSYDKLDRVI